jgi:hypothetical protein
LNRKRLPDGLKPNSSVSLWKIHGVSDNSAVDISRHALLPWGVASFFEELIVFMSAV